MALRSGYKGFKKLLGLKMIRPGTLAVDDAALSKTFFPRSEQAILGAGNFMPDTVYTLGMASTLGTVTLATNSEAVAYVAPIKRNTHYWISKSAGNRFRLALSNIRPADGTTATLIYTNDTAMSYEFDSGSYDYAILLANIGEIDASTIKPLLALFKDTVYGPPAMTNEQLTDAISLKTGAIQIETGLTSGDFHVWERDEIVNISGVVYNGSFTHESYTDIGTISGVSLPTSTVRFTVVTNAAANLVGVITTEGKIRIYDYGSDVSTNVTFNFSYMT